MASGLLVLALLSLLCVPLFVDTIAHDAPRVEGGMVDYGGWGVLSAPVELRGSWQLVWQAGDAPAGSRARVPVPGAWSGLPTETGAKLPSTGVASFLVTMRGLSPGRYILHVPVIFGADRVFLNGRQVGSHGRIGASAATTRADVRSYEIAFEGDGKPVSVRVDIASFQHRDTGMVDAPVLGLESPMRRWITLQWAKAFLFQTSLLLLAVITLIGFLQRRSDRASLYMSLTTLCVLPGSGILSYDNLLLIAMPGLPFPAMLALQYIVTGSLSLAFLLAYARALYPLDTPRWLYLGLQGVICCHLLAEATAFLVWGTRAASVVAIEWPAVLALVFPGIMVIVARAAWRGRDGAAIFLVGVSVFTAFAVNAALAWSGLVAPDFLLGSRMVSFGMLILLFSHVVVIAQRWSLAIVAAEHTSADLRELLEVSSAVTSEIHLEALLARIIEVTSRMLDADRCTLLLHDVKTGELWSVVAEGMETREIRFPSTVGLAGHVFTTGETLQIEDVANDPRFNRAIDVATGYRTRSMLAMPIASRDGRRLGVIQALNRKSAPSFTPSDAERMAAFAAQSAIAIENATLFSEVVESRNYNESILRSMSNGVVTLDRDTGIGKLNAAACRILGLPPTGVDDVDARSLLGKDNPWLIEEIEAVSASGQPKMLLDVDVVTVRETVALNISIVPLQTEGEVLGVLLLIEDISEGKRMQGAMRRFMTQKVVDQVLGRGDELMFGTACTASVLFADIRNFTSMAEALTARDTVDMLNEAFTEFVEAVSAQDGVLDKFIGDAIMAVYGAPLSTGRDAENAVESGLQMLRMLAELNQRRGLRGLPSLRLGVGIATGEVVAGTIGSPKRMDYTVIGDSVNLAARLQDLTKPYGVEMLVCETTAAAVSGRHRLRELDLIRVRGRQQPSKIFEVLPGRAEGGSRARLLDAYQRGRASLGQRDWAGAVRAFREATMIDAADQPAALMLERATILASSPPDAAWDGVWMAAAKG